MFIGTPCSFNKKDDNNNDLIVLVADKLHWTFKLYDKDGSGEIGDFWIYSVVF